MPLTVQEVLTLSTAWLARHGSDTPRLDAELLTAHALGIKRVDLYLSLERPITNEERARLHHVLRRRGSGEPVAYIRGVREFYGIELLVARGVLIPRPETEVLVDEVLRLLAGLGGAPLVADVGTGSGAIACAVAIRDPRVRVIATDISQVAVEIARKNCERLGLVGRVEVRHCDLLDAVPRAPCLDVVVSNPPYVAEGEVPLLDKSVRDFEPREALLAGPDGMAVTKRLLGEAVVRLVPGGSLVLEVGSRTQAGLTESLLQHTAGLTGVRALKDAAGAIRGYSASKVAQCTGAA